MPSFGITGEGVSISKINFSILILSGSKKKTEGWAEPRPGVATR